MIASKEPRWRLTSIISELELNSKIISTIFKWAEELIGKNSDIPWTIDRIIISKIFENI